MVQVIPSEVRIALIENTICASQQGAAKGLNQQRSLFTFAFFAPLCSEEDPPSALYVTSLIVDQTPGCHLGLSSLASQAIGVVKTLLEFHGHGGGSAEATVRAEELHQPEH